MGENMSLNTLLLISLLAFFVPFIVKKLPIKIPIVVAEIIAGFIIGTSGLDLINEEPWLEFLAMFGFAYLMFLSGLEIEFRAVIESVQKKESFWRGPLGLAIFTFSGTLSIALVVALLLGRSGLVSSPWLMMLIISTTSLGVVVPTLKEKGIAKTDYGQALLFCTLIADFVTMLMVTIVVGYLVPGGGGNIYLVGILIVFFFAVSGVVRYFSRSRVAGLVEELAHATSQVRVRGSLALVFIFIALSQTLGLEIILGAFLAGVVISLLSERERAELQAKHDAIGYGFFIPIFFINVGASFDLKALSASPEALLLVPILFVAAFIVKFIPALIFRLRYTWKETVGAGFLLATRLSLIIAISKVGTDLGLISSAINSAIILVALASVIIFPILFERLIPSKKIKIPNIFIIGGGEEGYMVARRMARLNQKVFKVNLGNEKLADPSRLQQFALVTIPKITSRELAAVGIEKDSKVLVFNTDACSSYQICQELRELQVKNIVAIAQHTAQEQQLKQLGVMTVIPALASLTLAEHLLMHSETVSLLFNSGGEQEIILEELVLGNKDYFGEALSKINLPGDCLVLGVVRNGQRIIPHGDTTLEHGDTLVMIGTREFILEAIQELS